MPSRIRFNSEVSGSLQVGQYIRQTQVFLPNGPTWSHMGPYDMGRRPNRKTPRRIGKHKARIGKHESENAPGPNRKTGGPNRKTERGLNRKTPIRKQAAQSENRNRKTRGPNGKTERPNRKPADGKAQSERPNESNMETKASLLSIGGVSTWPWPWTLALATKDV